MSNAFYPTEYRFGFVIRTRLGRLNRTVGDLATYLGCSPENLMKSFSGGSPAGTFYSFKELDRFFGTSPGYMEECFKNCSAILLAELNPVLPTEEVNVSFVTPPEVPGGMMLVPAELIKCVLADIGRGHDYTDNSLELLELFKAHTAKKKPTE